MRLSARIGKHLRGNAVAYVALFVALTAGAYAATKAPKNSVVSKSIKNGQVKTKDLRDDAVTAPKLAPPEAWHGVGPGSTTEDLCDDASNTAVFCSFNFGGFHRWANFGSGFATAAFYKGPFGIVHLRGVVTNVPSVGASTFPRSILRLPSAYRPESTRIFSSIGAGPDSDVTQARIDVQGNGLVVLAQDCDSDFSDCSATGEYVTLDGINFRPDE